MPPQQEYRSREDGRNIWITLGAGPPPFLSADAPPVLNLLLSRHRSPFCLHGAVEATFLHVSYFPGSKLSEETVYKNAEWMELQKHSLWNFRASMAIITVFWNLEDW